MVGRAATGRAWLPGAIGVALEMGASTIRRPDAALRHDMLTQHYEWLLTHFGIDAGVRHARKHLAAAMDDHLAQATGSEAAALAPLRAEVLTTAHPARVMAGLAEIFAVPDQACAA
jgi:tRNA-dihydrouridine synthase